MKLDAYLEQKNMPVEQFADLIGVHRTSVYRFIKGLAFPRPSTLKRITQETGGRVTANDFVALIPQRDLASTG
jgi:transcriptional regulator with XRE-family HTH domain